MTTTLRIPATDILAEIHRIGRRHGLPVDIVDMGPPQSGGSPYRWRLAVGDPDTGLHLGVAVRDAGELVEAVEWAWSKFVKWGLS